MEEYLQHPLETAGHVPSVTQITLQFEGLFPAYEITLTSVYLHLSFSKAQLHDALRQGLIPAFCLMSDCPRSLLILKAFSHMEREQRGDVMRTSAEDFFLRSGPQQVQLSKRDFSKSFLNGRVVASQGIGLLLKNFEFKAALV